MTKNNGIAYGRVTRQMVMDMKDDVSDIKTDIKNLTNHYSKRLPIWTTILIALLSSLVVGLITKGVYGI